MRPTSIRFRHSATNSLLASGFVRSMLDLISQSFALPHRCRFDRAVVNFDFIPPPSWWSSLPLVPSVGVHFATLMVPTVVSFQHKTDQSSFSPVIPLNLRCYVSHASLFSDVGWSCPVRKRRPVIPVPIAPWADLSALKTRLEPTFGYRSRRKKFHTCNVRQGTGNPAKRSC